MRGLRGVWAWVVAGLVLGLAPGAHARDRLKELERRMARLEAELARRPLDVSDYRLPAQVSFCGEVVDLSNPWIRERLEKEFLLVLGERAQTVLWMKRARRVFPVIEAEAKALGTCTDLKYLAVVESSLRPAVSSHASAKGWWQFMAGTGRQYGLDVDRAWDERADLDASTRAGLKYLVDLKERFGTWSLAMAAYNTGPNRLQKARETQGINSFWRLDLLDEAERYVPRIIAVKIVMSDAAGYGFQTDVKDGWAPIPTGTVKARLAEGREVAVVDVARGAGVDYRVLRQLNPELGGDYLPMGRAIELTVPRGTESEVRRAVEAAAAGAPLRQRPAARGEDAPPPRRAAPATEAPKVAARKPEPEIVAKAPRATGRGARSHVVKKGDSLWSLAQDHKVSVGDLRRWNKLDNRTPLVPGQVLVVRPGK